MSKKNPDISKYVIDAHVLVQENHININPEW